MTEIFIEAESFENRGGWVVDSQSMETLNSAYLMAHGIGKPVSNAQTSFTTCEDAVLSVYALTRDWTAVWGVLESAGKFKIEIDGKPLHTTLGTNGADWAFQKAGEIPLKSGEHTISLCDLTGFNARCDAVYITSSKEVPKSDADSIEALRKRLNYKQIKDSEKEWDLIVVGGGIAGICTAISAIRSGVNTLLIHDREMLGGCNSSEVQVCLGGMINLPPYENLGNVVKEIAPVMTTPQTYGEAYFEDFRKSAVFENRTFGDTDGDYKLLLNSRVTACEKIGDEISAVITTDTLSGKKTRHKARLFADCSGDATLSRLSGCRTMYGREAESEFGETLAPKEHQKLVMGHSIRWYSEKSEKETSFPDINWNLDINDSNCLNVRSGDWEQETGFRRDMVSEIEYIRDYGLRAIYQNWSFQKNHHKNREEYKFDTIKWVSPIGGKRESYRVVGGHILTQQDVEEHRIYPDASACATWSIDMHFPEPSNEKEFGEAFRSYAYHRGIVRPYPVPYRCLYAADVKNLFLGGRIISSSHVAFSCLRVMRTLGALGEVAGLAAGICKRECCNPCDVYVGHLEKLIEKLKEGVKIPFAFQCAVGDEEAYHYKDLGWLFIHPDASYYCDRPQNVKKFSEGIKNLGLKHKYPLHKDLK